MAVYRRELKEILDYLRDPSPLKLIPDLNKDASFVANKHTQFLAKDISSGKWKDAISQTDPQLENTSENFPAVSEYSTIEDKNEPEKAGVRIFLIREEEEHARPKYVSFIHTFLRNILPGIIAHLDQPRGCGTRIKKSEAAELELYLFALRSSKSTEAKKFCAIKRLVQMGWIGKLDSGKHGTVDIVAMALDLFLTRLMNFVKQKRTELHESEFVELAVVNVAQLLKTFVHDRRSEKDLRLWISRPTQTDSEMTDSSATVNQTSLSAHRLLHIWLSLGSTSQAEGTVITPSTEDTMEEFCAINKEAYAKFKSLAHQRKELRHAYTQGPMPVGYITQHHGAVHTREFLRANPVLVFVLTGSEDANIAPFRFRAKAQKSNSKRNSKKWNAHMAEDGCAFHHWLNPRHPIEKVSRSAYLHGIIPFLIDPFPVHVHLGCANCGRPEREPNTMKVCEQCVKNRVEVRTSYCSEECALVHWFEHRKFHEATTELSHFDYEREREAVAEK